MKADMTHETVSVPHGVLQKHCTNTPTHTTRANLQRNRVNSSETKDPATAASLRTNLTLSNESYKAELVEDRRLGHSGSLTALKFVNFQAVQTRSRPLSTIVRVVCVCVCRVAVFLKCAMWLGNGFMGRISLHEPEMMPNRDIDAT